MDFWCFYISLCSKNIFHKTQGKLLLSSFLKFSIPAGLKVEAILKLKLETTLFFSNQWKHTLRKLDKWYAGIEIIPLQCCQYWTRSFKAVVFKVWVRIDLVKKARIWTIGKDYLIWVSCLPQNKFTAQRSVH